eukprot:3412124-Prymnesium_polylepis.3
MLLQTRHWGECSLLDCPLKSQGGAPGKSTARRINAVTAAASRLLMGGSRWGAPGGISPHPIRQPKLGWMSMKFDAEPDCLDRCCDVAP